MKVKGGFKIVPVEPTAEQYGGLARDIIQWMRFTPSSDQHSQSLIGWLKNMENEIPSWLMSENEINHLSKHVLSKGTIAAIIYKAMLEAATKDEVPQWIPVSERLPDEGTYFCLGHNGTPFVCLLRNKKYEGYVWLRNTGTRRVDGITHWMPLPAPPEQNK